MTHSTRFIFAQGLTFLALLASPAFVHAQEYANEYEEQYALCVDEFEGINNSVVAECSIRVLDNAEADIRVTYERLYDTFEAEDAEALQHLDTAQQAWMAYRSSHCELAAQYIGSPMMSFCPMQLTVDRALALRELVGE